MLILFLLAAASNAPTSEAEALGLRLARTSGIVAIAPMLIQKDLADLAAEEPSLSPEQRGRLFEIGNEEGKEGDGRTNVQRQRKTLRSALRREAR